VQETLRTLLAGIPSLLVAVVGILGVLITQAKADGREARIAAAARESDRATRGIDQQREVAADFMALILVIAWHARKLPKGSFWLDAFDDPKELTRAVSRIAVICDAKVLAAAESMIDAHQAMIESPSNEGRKAVEESEDAFLAAVKETTADTTTRW
jgi:hypothetical protein